jgi:membrane protease YdiL (CAAX protease family)
VPANRSSSISDQPTLVSRYPIITYFVTTFAISWAGAFAVAAPHIFRHEPLPKLTGVLMFPAMLLGPSLTGILLTGLLHGRQGLKNLFSRMARLQVPFRWYATLLIPPILIFTVLTLLRFFASSAYSPNLFWLGLFFAIPAGFLEEIGWMGYAFSDMVVKKSFFFSSMLLGLLWSLWHLPVINFLGVATPHGDYWFAFFLAFSTAMTAMRVIICWIYTYTKSVLLAQLMHICSTGSLIIFGAAHLTAAQEALWYGVYGVALWVVVGIIALRNPRLTNA